MIEKLIFTPQEEDLKAAYRLHMTHNRFKRIGYFLLFGMAVGIAVAAWNGFNSINETIGLIAGMTLWAGFIALLFSVIAPLWWAPWYAKKIYKQQKDLRLEMTTCWDDEKLYSSNDQGHGHLAFADMVKWRSDDNVVLMYRSDQLYNFLPTRIFKQPAAKAGLIRRLQDSGIPGEEQS